jgi:hypothetical protein
MNWLKEVADTSTLDGLLAVVNDYILGHPEEHWSWIPRASRPPLIASLEELQHWHRKICDDLAAARAPNIRMQDLCVFFVRAAARAIELQATQPASSNESITEPAANGQNG